MRADINELTELLSTHTAWGVNSEISGDFDLKKYGRFMRVVDMLLEFIYTPEMTQEEEEDGDKNQKDAFRDGTTKIKKGAQRGGASAAVATSGGGRRGASVDRGMPDDGSESSSSGSGGGGGVAAAETKESEEPITALLAPANSSKQSRYHKRVLSNDVDPRKAAVPSSVNAAASAASEDIRLAAAVEALETGKGTKQQSQHSNVRTKMNATWQGGEAEYHVTTSRSTMVFIAALHKHFAEHPEYGSSDEARCIEFFGRMESSIAHDGLLDRKSTLNTFTPGNEIL